LLFIKNEEGGCTWRSTKRQGLVETIQELEERGRLGREEGKQRRSFSRKLRNGVMGRRFLLKPTDY